MASKIILFHSKFSSHCKDLQKLMAGIMPAQSVCIDNAQVREQIMRDTKFGIQFVPCILIMYPNGSVEKYEGDDAFELVTKNRNEYLQAQQQEQQRIQQQAQQMMMQQQEAQQAQFRAQQEAMRQKKEEEGDEEGDEEFHRPPSPPRRQKKQPSQKKKKHQSVEELEESEAPEMGDDQIPKNSIKRGGDAMSIALQMEAERKASESQFKRRGAPKMEDIDPSMRA